jgi:hypothetical protein
MFANSHLHGVEMLKLPCSFRKLTTRQVRPKSNRSFLIMRFSEDYNTFSLVLQRPNAQV